jgi:hypothetical protein
MKKEQKSSAIESAPKMPLRVFFFVVLQKEFPEIIEPLKGEPLTHYLQILDGNSETERAFHISLETWAIRYNLTKRLSIANFPENEILAKTNKGIVLKDGRKIYDKKHMPVQWCLDFAEQYIQMLATGNERDKKAKIFTPAVPMQGPSLILEIESFIESLEVRYNSLLTTSELSPNQSLLNDLRQVIDNHNCVSDEWEEVECTIDLFNKIKWTVTALCFRKPSPNEATDKAVERMMKRLGFSRLPGRPIGSRDFRKRHRN